MNSVRRFSLFILVMMLLSSSEQSQFCLSQDNDINSLIVRMRENVRVLETVAYDAEVSVRRIGTDGKETKLKYGLEFKADGNRYYSRLRLESDNGESTDRTVAFDGTTFESFDEEQSVLQFTSIPPEDLPYLFPQPFVYLYGFVFGGNRQLDLPMLSDAEHWREFQDRITSVESMEPETGSSKTTKLNFRLSDGEGSVLLSERENWLPVQVDAKTGGMKSVLRVEKATPHLHKDKTIHFPLEIIDQAFDDDGVLRYELEASLDPTSVKLNEAYQSSDFKIDRSRARWLDDVDGRLAGKAAIVEINPKISLGSRTNFLIAGFLAIFLGAWILTHLRKGRASEG